MELTIHTEIGKYTVLENKEINYTAEFTSAKYQINSDGFTNVLTIKNRFSKTNLDLSAKLTNHELYDLRTILNEFIEVNERDKYYRTFGSVRKKGFDLYYYDGKDYDVFGGNFDSINQAVEHAEKYGYTRNRTLEASIDN